MIGSYGFVGLMENIDEIYKKSSKNRCGFKSTAKTGGMGINMKHDIPELLFTTREDFRKWLCKNAAG